ncbi:MAG: glutamate--tRNA ligase [Candidatus Marsarchaeota archaeon]|jgi:glutamyl-tRNA synthetase|nr:glutamate--tRNA ligase [Candidatus Marsarchaeota archaeon]MCL5418340.1 glutamate--tRNA ligase [Candidatus Marsarchaeota archaeon]
MNESELDSLILKYAVKNAIDYGKASLASVLGKVLSKLSNEDKGNIAQVRKEVDKIVSQVNLMSREELSSEYSKHSDEFSAEEKAKIAATSKPGMVLEGAVSGAFATRYAPEPNGFMHIGNAKAAMLADEFAKIYNGKMFLYFDDTNPEKEEQQFVDAIRYDSKWLGITFSGEYYASDSIEDIYKYAEQAILNGKAYMCTCTPEQIKDNRFKMLECEHRDQGIDKNMQMFKSMLSGEHNMGEAALRLKGDMKSQNSVMRDPVIMRVKKHVHYRQGSKYIVWPTYDFNTPIMDSLHGITDAIRSKEYELRNELYYAVLDAVGLRKPRMHLEARLVIKNNVTHKRVLRTLISEGKLSGYDDPRLVTIAALRRRGVQPEAIRKFVLRFGMSMVDSVVSMDMLLSENKSIIDPMAKRLFYVEDPVKLVISNAKSTEVDLRMHPTVDMGSRHYTVNSTFYISRRDSELSNGEVIRLKDLYNIKVTGHEGGIITAEKIEGGLPAKKLQWVSEGNFVKCRITIPGSPLNDDGSFNENSIQHSTGYIESHAAALSNGNIVQLERYGYCIADNIKNMEFIFISK